MRQYAELQVCFLGSKCSISIGALKGQCSSVLFLVVRYSLYWHRRFINYRNAALNFLIWQALVRARFSSFEEPVELMKSDGKRPNDATFTPWQARKTLTCSRHLVSLLEVRPSCIWDRSATRDWNSWLAWVAIWFLKTSVLFQRVATTMQHFNATALRGHDLKSQTWANINQFRILIHTWSLYIYNGKRQSNWPLAFFLHVQNM